MLFDPFLVFYNHWTQHYNKAFPFWLNGQTAESFSHFLRAKFRPRAIAHFEKPQYTRVVCTNDSQLIAQMCSGMKKQVFESTIH